MEKTTKKMVSSGFPMILQEIVVSAYSGIVGEQASRVIEERTVGDRVGTSSFPLTVSLGLMKRKRIFFPPK